MNKKTLGLLTILSLFSTNFVFADSTKILNSTNGHYYQRFDSVDINWNLAKYNCENLGSHLVTIPRNAGTTNSENDFVHFQLVAKSPNADPVYFIGAYYDEKALVWKWVTGETFGTGFSQSNWVGFNYYAMVSDGFWTTEPVDSASNNTLGYPPTVTGYICEWDSNNFVANATIKDLNANNVPENASLYLDSGNNKHTVKIRDPKSKTTISTLTFATSSIAPIGLAVIKDTNANNIPDVAVLSGLTVQIKDAKSNTTVLKSISFLSSSYQPRAITMMPDSNNNGYDELTVLGVNGSKTVSETRDSKTGVLLFSDSF